MVCVVQRTSEREEMSWSDAESEEESDEEQEEGEVLSDRCGSVSDWSCWVQIRIIEGESLFDSELFDDWET